MWIFKLGMSGALSGLFMVGFYTPNGEYYHTEEYRTREEAANRVHFLNGGDSVLPAFAKKYYNVYRGAATGKIFSGIPYTSEHEAKEEIAGEHEHLGIIAIDNLQV